jgi:coenzyme F420 hydrogenase subunit beta
VAHRIEDVVDRGMCIGCGACGVATSGAIPVTLGRYGMYQASLEGVSEPDRRAGSRVCPFSDDAANEDELGAPTPEGNRLPHDTHLGRHGRVFAGRRLSTGELLESSSGGLTSWMLRELLERGEVDAVLHVAQRTAGQEMFGYAVSSTVAEVESRKKSLYYSTTFRDVLLQAKGDGRRYAIVGVPCFIKAARLLCRDDAELASQLRYFVGIVCGHLKSQFFAESLAWQVGVPPGELETVDFRLKVSDRPAVDYDFGALKRGGEDFVRRRTGSLLGGNWGHGAFQPEACNFCDDVFAETADVVFGDAWLPEYNADWRGTNVVVSRNMVIDALLQDGMERGEIELEEISTQQATASQAGNFRHRRDGLAVRLADDIAAGLSVPKKRVAPGLDHVTARRRRLIRQRRRMSARSLVLFATARETGNLPAYTKPMEAEVARYRRIDRPLLRRLVKRGKAIFDRLKGRLTGRFGASV